ncbi:MAG: hypothetical protein IPM35_32175 [Myxococcales bacterium]|nr:hypothetical protein [Myxococcales bacterium]
MRRLPRVLAVSSATLLLLSSRGAWAAETFDAFTFSSLVNQNVNVMAANQRLLRAQELVDYDGWYFGFASRGAPASYRMSDGSTLDAGVARVLLATGGRVANLVDDLSLYAGVQLDHASASDFPNVMSPAGSGKGKGELVVGFFSEAVLHGGASYQGFSLSAGVMAQTMRFDADPAGRFVPYGYPDDEDRNFRPGTPALVRARQGEQQTQWNYFANLDSDRGYSLGALFGQVEELTEQGQSQVASTLAALRALAQPRDLLRSLSSQALGYPGLGLNRYAPGVDYYGDRFEELQAAVRDVRPIPPTRSEALYEVPLVWDRILGIPVGTRLVPQVSPELLFRLAEVSAAFQAGVFEAGARAMVFRRGDAYTGATDLYAGVHVTDPKEKKGISVNASYSFNNPDSATFLPLPNAHVLGLGFMLGLPEALPPPVPIARDPLEKEQPYTGEGVP